MESPKRLAGRLAALLLVPGCLLHGQEASTNAVPDAVESTRDARASLRALTFQPGFAPELVASEPLVVDPVDLCFDEQGRMYVIELRGFPVRGDQRLGRIKLLVDTDHDGRFDEGNVFAEDLKWPSALFYARDGLFVVDAPDLLFIKDSDGDGIADARRVVFTGLSNGGEQSDLTSVPNSLRWGLDNRIHGASGKGGGRISPTGVQGEPLDLKDRDFSFDPRSFNLRVESGGGGFGMCYDNQGRKYATGPDGSTLISMYDLRYGVRNPFFVMPNPLVELSGAQVDVPRYGDYLYGATIFRGSAWGPRFVGDLLIADPARSVVHQRKVRPSERGVTMEASREAKTPSFLASTDNWFSPVQLANTPDGSIYVLDMYRPEFPGQPSSDLNSGGERGRIFRVVPRNFREPPVMDLSKATTAQLVGLLTHPNAWHRETAARLLYERQDRSCVKLLLQFFNQSPSPVARMHALYALDGQLALDANFILRALADKDALVREHAVKLSERLVNRTGRIPEAVWKKLDLMTDDPSPRVRYQLAFTLGEIEHPDQVLALIEILRRDHADPWVRAAALSSIRRGAGRIFASLWNQDSVRNSTDGEALLRDLIFIAGARAGTEETGPVVDVLAEISDLRSAFQWTTRLAQGLDQGGSSLRVIDTDGRLMTIIQSALGVAISKTDEEPLRLSAIELLGWWEDEAITRSLLGLLEIQGISPAIHSESLASLGTSTDPRVLEEILSRWKWLDADQRRQVARIAIPRPAWTKILLGGMEEGTVSSADLSFHQRNQLRQYPDTQIRWQAVRALGSIPDPAKSELLTKLQPALDLKGNARIGERVFQERCADCHEFQNLEMLGPGVRRTGASRQALLENIIDPSREIHAGYEAVEVELKTGARMEGLIVNETPTSLTLRRQDSPDTRFLKVAVQSVSELDRSLMPEGLLSDLTVQDVANLLSYLEAGR